MAKSPASPAAGLSRPGQAEGADARQRLAHVAADAIAAVSADLADRLQVGQPVEEALDVAAAQRRRDESTIGPAAEELREHPQTVDLAAYSRSAAASMARELFCCPPFDGLGQPGLADSGERQVPAMAEDREIPNVFGLFAPGSARARRTCWVKAVRSDRTDLLRVISARSVVIEAACRRRSPSHEHPQLYLGDFRSAPDALLNAEQHLDDHQHRQRPQVHLPGLGHTRFPGLPPVADPPRSRRPALSASAGSGCCNSRRRRRRSGCTPQPGKSASAARAAPSGQPETGPSTSVVAEGGTSWRAARTTPRVAPSARTGIPAPRIESRARARRAAHAAAAISALSSSPAGSGARSTDDTHREAGMDGVLASAATRHIVLPNNRCSAGNDSSRVRRIPPRLVQESAVEHPRQTRGRTDQHDPVQHMRELAAVLARPRLFQPASQRSPGHLGLLARTGHRVDGGPQP